MPANLDRDCNHAFLLKVMSLFLSGFIVIYRQPMRQSTAVTNGPIPVEGNLVSK